MSRLSRALAWNGPLVSLLGLALALGAGLLLTRLSPFQAVAVALVVGVSAATLAEPLVGLLAGLFLGLMRAYIQTEVPQVPAQIGHLFVGLAAAAWVGRGLAKRELCIPWAPELLPLLGFVAAAWLSLWKAVDLAGYGLLEFIKWLEILLVALIVIDQLRAGRLSWLLMAVLLVGLFQAGVGLYQFLLLEEGPEHFLIGGTDSYRAYGTFEQPNPYAGYLGITLSLAAGVLLVALGDSVAAFKAGGLPRPHSWRGLLLVLLPIALVLAASLGASWSRGAWLGFAAAGGVMAVALPRRTRWGVLLVVALVLTGLTLYVSGLVPASILSRLTDFAVGLRLEDVRGVGINDTNYAVIERLAHWQAALGMWRHSFWTGVGLGCYEPAYPAFALINWPIALGHAHNIYLNMLAETGLTGLGTYLLFLGTILQRTWRATRRTDGLRRGIALGLLGAWTHLSVHSLFDNLYVNNVHLLIGLLLGLLAALGTGDEGDSGN